MKNYTITVNGVAYDVTVEEGTGNGAAPVARAAAPKAAPKAAPAAAPKAAAGAGSVKVTASVPGKVFKVEASVGQSVKAGDPIVVLEAMKMEIRSNCLIRNNTRSGSSCGSWECCYT